MRTQENFTVTYEEAKRFTRWHGFVWIVPTNEDYRLSIIEPHPEDLPKGTSAVSLEYSKVEKDWQYARLSVQAKRQ